MGRDGVLSTGGTEYNESMMITTELEIPSGSLLALTRL